MPNSSTRPLRILLVFGGPSVEHVVSIISARSVAAAVDPTRFRIVPCWRTADERWASVAESADRLRRRVDAVADQGTPIPEEVFHLPEGSAEPERLARAGEVDVAFPLVHGTWGEDGALQGYLESCGLPYVGAGVRASVVGMDKAAMKALFRDAGLPGPRYEVVHLADPERRDPARLRKKLEPLGLPLFVKPVNAGSSIGITKVKEWDQLPAAVELAFRFDEKAIFEEGLSVREIECGVLGDLAPECAPPGEIVPGHEFYDYDDKYFDDKSYSVIPAKLDSETAERARRLALDVFVTIGCSGLARVDLFLEKTTGRLLVNEINTLPGFTAISMYPKLWAAAGIPYPELISRLIDLGVERDRRRRTLAGEARAFLEERSGGKG
jgi:D-alanine-D-alanine ligase